MKRISFVLSAAAALLLVSCAKEIAPSQSGSSQVREGKTYVQVGTPDSKTYLDEPDASGKRKVFWLNGDKININGSDSEPLTGIAPGTSSAQFEFNALLDYPYNLVYPASAWKAANTIAIPREQAYTKDSFDPAAAIAVAYAAQSGDPLNLKNPCAVLKFALKKGTETVAMKKLVFFGNDSEQVSGEFTVNYQNASLTGASDSPADKRVMVDISSLTLTESASYIYLVVPAITYSKGFSFRICDANGHFMNQVKSSSVTLEPGKVYKLSDVTYEPTGTLVDISTADEYIAFATSFKAGTYGSKDKNLMVFVTADLDFKDKTFTTVDNATYIFGGIWEGNGYAMKNIVSVNTPVFYTPSGANIRNIVLDKSCSFTKNATGNGHWAALVRILSGADSKLSGCIMNCDWNFDYGNLSSYDYGALVGRNEGVVEYCQMNGDVIYTRTIDTKLTSYIYVGGMVGTNYTATATMRHCVNTGKLIFNEPKDEYKPVCATADKYFCVGGILGKNVGTAEYLTMKGDVDYQDYVMDTFLGGVVGNNEGVLVDNCRMEGNVIALQTKAAKDAYKRLFVGGVVGRTWKGTVSNCSNLAGKTARAESGTNSISLGGVLGTSGGSAVIQDVENNMTVEMKTVGAYYAYIGGVIGTYGSGVSVKNKHINNGPVNVDVFCNLSGAQTHVGGVAGYANTAINGGTISSNKSSIHNNAQITTAALRACTGFSNVNFGGVVGRLDQNATNLTNSGKVYMNFGDDKDQTSILKYVSAGGIIGRVAKAVTVDGCVNTGNVQFRYWTDAANNAKINYMGGIVGCVMSGANIGGLAATIKNCTSYGAISTSNNNTTYPSYSPTGGIGQGKLEGGCIGVILGTDGARATVENCVSASKTAHNISNGYFGCVVGMALYTDIKNCKNTTPVTGAAGSGCTIGGILGITSYKVKITGCEVDFKLDKFAVAGGIAAACNTGGDNFATIEGNKVNIVATTTFDKAVFGAVARNPVAVTVVQDNGIKGSYNGQAFSESYAPYCGTATFTCDPAKPNYIITD